MAQNAAVIIGINYDVGGARPGLPPLRYAEADARAVAAILEPAGYAVALLLGAAATREAIARAIPRQRRAAGADGLLLIHFSGHGALDPDDPHVSYLLPADTDVDELSATAIALDYLVQRHVGPARSSVTLLDCCHSGAALGWRDAGPPAERGRAFLSEARAAFTGSEGRVVLAACAGDERARELPELGHGVFTHALLEHWAASADEVTPESLFLAIDRGLEARRLPRPVRGGTHEGRLILRPAHLAPTRVDRPSPDGAPRGPTPPGAPLDEARRQQLYRAIAALDPPAWQALLTAFGEAEGVETRPARARRLIAEMAAGGWLGLLEDAVAEQTTVTAASAQQAREARDALAAAVARDAWDEAITLGEPLLQAGAAPEARRAVADAYCARGRARHEAGDYAGALADASRALALAPDLAAAYNARAEAHHELGDYAAAMADHNRAVDLAPREAAYYNARSVTRHTLGDYDQSLADSNRAVDLAPTEAEHRYSRGVTYHVQGDFARALADKTRAVELAPHEAEFHYSRGATYYALGEYDRALADESRAIELAPTEARYYLSRSYTQMALGAGAAALADATRAIALDPENPTHYQRRGLLAHEQGDHGAAVADFSRAIALAPGEGRYYDARAATYREQGDLAAALADHDRAIELAPEEAAYYDGRAETHNEQDAHAAALADFSRAIALDPQNAQYYQRRAETYAVMGAADRALADATRAIDLAPHDGDPYYHRAWIYDALGDRAAARKDFARSAELGHGLARAQLEKRG
jgi:tetratricopeptide (TPR) repeat protein